MGHLNNKRKGNECARNIDGSFCVSSALSEAIRFAVVTTDRCQARCAHCLMKSAPERPERLTLEQIMKLVDHLVSNTAVKMVVFTGGESTLLGDDLLEAISYCAARGLLTRLVTNAAWATDDQLAKRTIRDLRDAGLSEINYSTDDFHCAWIPFSNIERAWRAAKDEGFLSVLIATCSGPHSKITPEIIQKRLNERIETYENTSENDNSIDFTSGGDTKYLISVSQLSKLGRGATLPEKYFPSYTSLQKNKLYGACPCLMDPPTLNPDGTLGACCGISTEGNPILNLGFAEDVLGDPEFQVEGFQGLILRAIQTVGPAYLYHMASESASGISKMRARNVCEVCEELTTNNDLLNSLRDKADIVACHVKRNEDFRMRLRKE